MGGGGKEEEMGGGAREEEIGGDGEVAGVGSGGEEPMGGMRAAAESLILRRKRLIGDQFWTEDVYTLLLDRILFIVYMYNIWCA
ncbi:hypothetical protein V2J09_020698 [Rumex salicifolius]